MTWYNWRAFGLSRQPPHAVSMRYHRHLSGDGHRIRQIVRNHSKMNNEAILPGKNRLLADMQLSQSGLPGHPPERDRALVVSSRRRNSLKRCADSFVLCFLPQPATIIFEGHRCVVVACHMICRSHTRRCSGEFVRQVRLDHRTFSRSGSRNHARRGGAQTAGSATSLR
jgi:hypothetical protein